MAGRSVELMTILFTELNDSADIFLLPPSRKGLKRIPAEPAIVLPRNLPNLRRRIQQNVTDVARAGLLQHLSKPGRCMAKNSFDRYLDVVMKQQHISNASEARVFLMQRELKLNSSQ